MGQCFHVIAPQRREVNKGPKFSESLFYDSCWLQLLLAVPIIPAGFGLSSKSREPTQLERRGIYPFYKRRRRHMVSRNVLHFCTRLAYSRPRGVAMASDKGALTGES
jgi:hypothetical protein